MTAPPGAAALSGEGLLFWEECFHLAYIKRIDFAVTRQAQRCAGASFPSAPATLQLDRSWIPAVLAHTQLSLLLTRALPNAVSSHLHPSIHTLAERLLQPTRELLSSSLNFRLKLQH